MRSSNPNHYVPTDDFPDQPSTTVFNGALLLHSEPVLNLHAATKSYVDTLFGSKLDTVNLDSGIVQPNTMPSFSGDVVSLPGETVFSLKSNVVTAATFTKVTVDTKGRITQGSGLTKENIPALPWSKITSGKPFTLSGYGITNGVKSTGDTLTGTIRTTGTPVSPLHAVNKDYLDSTVLGFDLSDNIGTVIAKCTTTSPVGYLRCNGAAVSKATYTDLYSVLGERFTPMTTSGNGKPWKNQQLINSNTATDITGWTLGTSIPGALCLSQAVVTKNRVYLLGGNNGSTVVSSVYTATIGGDGKLGTWSAGTNLPVAIQEAQAVVTKNRVYLLGITSSSAVYTAPINSDGTIGAWVASSNLPETVYGCQAVVTKGYVYLFGGRTSSIYLSKCYVAPINSDGTLGAWSIYGSLADIPYGSSLVITKNRVYLLGSKNGGGPSARTQVATINPDGTLGNWSIGVNLPVAVYNAQTLTVAGRVFLFGGENYSGALTSVYVAPINEDGTLGAWTATTNLPFARTQSQLIVTNGRVHLLGGRDTTDPLGNTYSAVFTGGSNDYSSSYDGSFVSSDPLNFNLPDLSVIEKQGVVHYIKY